MTNGLFGAALGISTCITTLNHERRLTITPFTSTKQPTGMDTGNISVNNNGMCTYFEIYRNIKLYIVRVRFI